jgi:hypothetical protein
MDAMPGSPQTPERTARTPGEEPPALPDRSTDETDAGWGDRPDRDDDDSRLRQDRPPHWDDI